MYEYNGLSCSTCNNNTSTAFSSSNDIGVFGYGASNIPLFGGNNFSIDYPGYDNKLSFNLTMQNYIVSENKDVSLKGSYNSYSIPIYYASSGGSIPYLVKNNIMDYKISNASSNLILSNSIPSSSIPFSSFTQFKNSHYLSFRGVNGYNSGFLPTAGFTFNFNSSIDNLYTLISNGSISDLTINLDFNAYVFYAKGSYNNVLGSPVYGSIPDYFSIINDTSPYSLFALKSVSETQLDGFFIVEPVHFNYSFVLSNFFNVYDKTFSITASLFDFLSSFPVLNDDYNIIINVVLTDNFNFSIMPSISLGGSFDTGYNVGYTDGYNNGNQDGYNGGYKIGYEKGSSVNPENNFSSLFFSLLNTPFLILKEGFNFELFGINFYGLIMTIITIAIVVFVVRFLKGHMGGDS